MLDISKGIFNKIFDKNISNIFSQQVTLCCKKRLLTKMFTD